MRYAIPAIQGIEPFCKLKFCADCAVDGGRLWDRPAHGAQACQGRQNIEQPILVIYSTYVDEHHSIRFFFLINVSLFWTRNLISKRRLNTSKSSFCKATWTWLLLCLQLGALVVTWDINTKGKQTNSFLFLNMYFIGWGESNGPRFCKKRD